MKQYCRYCGYLESGSRIWCREQEREISREAACAPNRCHSFAYHPVDALEAGSRISPGKGRKQKMGMCEGQISLF